MRKTIFISIFLALLLALTAVPASAQAVISLDFLRVQLWPEYDQSAMLVIYDFQVPASASFPQPISIRLPKDADLLAVAQQVNQNLVNVEYAPLTKDGEWATLSFTANQTGVYHIEYYAPLNKNASARDYTFTWPGDYAVTKLEISLQEPTGATQIKTDPTLPDVAPAADNFIYHHGVFHAVPGGKPFQMKITYSKSDDTLSASGSVVQAAGGDLAGNGVAGQSSFTTFLPWILGGLGLILLLGGGVWYWLSGRAEPKSPRTRHRAGAESESAEDEQIYCGQCGKRAQPGDVFCRSCGTRIRKNE